MHLESNYDVTRTASFILSGNFTRVALQLPDELLKDSTRVVSALRDKLGYSEGSASYKDVGLYVMVDTTYGSCCVDEVGASDINAKCVIHYGHTCLSPTLTLPALFVFGNAPISVSYCAENLSNYALTTGKPDVVLFGLEYTHAIEDMKEALVIELPGSHGSTSKLELYCADVLCSVMNPSENFKTSNAHLRLDGGLTANQGSGNTIGKQYSIGDIT